MIGIVWKMLDQIAKIKNEKWLCGKIEHFDHRDIFLELFSTKSNVIVNRDNNWTMNVIYWWSSNHRSSISCVCVKIEISMWDSSVIDRIHNTRLEPSKTRSQWNLYCVDNCAHKQFNARRVWWYLPFAAMTVQVFLFYSILFSFFACVPSTFLIWMNCKMKYLLVSTVFSYLMFTVCHWAIVIVLAWLFFTTSLPFHR